MIWIGEGTDLCDRIYVACDCQNALVNTWDDLADARLDACLVAEVGDVFTTLSDDDASIFRGDEGTEGEGVLTRRRGGTRLRGRVLCWREEGGIMSIS